MKRNEEDEKIRDEIFKKLEEIDNKLESIKSDTHNLNRIASISNTDIIINELNKIIGKSKIRAAIIHLTKEKINATDLAIALGIDPRNLRAFLNPFLGLRGYIIETKKGRERYYQRSELIDLVAYEKTEHYSSLLESWLSEYKQE